MKRLKVSLIVIFILVTLSALALASEVNKRRHRFFDSLSHDETLQSAVEHFQNRMDNLSIISGGMFETEWKQDDKGRTLYVTPKEKDLNLNIQIERGMVEIKTSNEKNTENSRSQSVSTQMMSIPSDCDPDKAKISQMDDGVKIYFPYREATKKIPSDRIPVKPSDDAIDI